MAASRYGGPSSMPWQSMWGSLCTKWHCYIFVLQFSPASYHSTDTAYLVITWWMYSGAVKDDSCTVSLPPHHENSDDGWWLVSSCLHLALFNSESRNHFWGCANGDVWKKRNYLTPTCKLQRIFSVVWWEADCVEAIGRIWVPLWHLPESWGKQRKSVYSLIYRKMFNWVCSKHNLQALPL